ncbi:cytochrome C [Malaciobacter mytili]|uniref:c-type cytochrome n=1 Tax=Malaciobacter mytili TaxID=603050 RepID=UPI00100AD679|nr:cytochrome c [Malaciobacter mytili]RXI43438.1 cytochrome C [Malaciobacter mytili]
MWLVFKIPLVLMSLYTSVFSNDKVFKEYCWGCHHQTSVAFGPSFEEIANKRTYGEIQGHIIAPRSTYKQLGYKRSVMPSFKDELTIKQLDEITNFIISFKKEN